MDEMNWAFLFVPLAIAIVFMTGSASRRQAKNRESIEMVDDAITKVKRAIELEKIGATADAKKHSDWLQQTIELQQAAPKRDQKRAQGYTNTVKETVEKGKKERIKSWKQNLETLQSSREALSRKQADHRAVNLFAYINKDNAEKQIDGFDD